MSRDVSRTRHKLLEQRGARGGQQDHVALADVVGSFVEFLVLRRRRRPAAALRPGGPVGHEPDSEARRGVCRDGNRRVLIVALAAAGLVGRFRLEPGFDRSVRRETSRVHRRGRVRHRVDPRAPVSVGPRRSRDEKIAFPTKPSFFFLPAKKLHCDWTTVDHNHGLQTQLFPRMDGDGISSHTFDQSVQKTRAR